MIARQAIQTKFLSPTNTRCARVKAFCQTRAIIVPWDDSQNTDENHYEAALQLASVMRWEIKGCTFGALPNNGYALTFSVTP